MNFMDYADLLKTKIKDRSAKVAVMGLGYVGLPLALEGAKAGFQVIGIDRDGEKVERISQGKNYLLDISEEELKQTVSSGHLIVTGEFCYLKEADIIVICVPTPLNIRKNLMFLI